MTLKQLRALASQGFGTTGHAVLIHQWDLQRLIDALDTTTAALKKVAQSRASEVIGEAFAKINELEES